MHALQRRLGLPSATLLIVGIIIGSGIFRVPGAVAAALPSPGPMLGAWILGGLLTLCGVLSYAELAAALPETGGDYVYLREIYGPAASFLFGWTQLVVAHSATIAGLAVVLAEYAAALLGLDAALVPHVAALAILLLTALNCLGLRAGAPVQNLLSGAKVLALLAIVLLALGSGRGRLAHFAVSAPLPGGLAAALPAALLPIFWSYSGWADLCLVAGEVREPGRNLPRALGLGVGLVMALYLLVNASYLLLVPAPQMAGAPAIAATALGTIFGAAGRRAIALLVVLSTCGSLNGLILTGGRIYYAMARDGLFFRAFGHVAPRTGAPVAALVLQGAWSLVLVFTLRRFETIVAYFSFAALAVAALSVLGVLVLRRTRPELPRPYRVPGYPLVPLLFLALAGALLIGTVRSDPRAALTGLGILVGSLPLYRAWRWLNRRAAAGSR